VSELHGREPAAPSASGPAAPPRSRPAAPSASRPAAPSASRPAVRPASRPAARPTSRPRAPSASRHAVPAASRPWHVAVGALAAGLALSQAGASLAIAAAAAVLACFAWLRAPRLAVVAAALLLAGSAVGDARLRALDHATTLIGDGRAMSAHAHLLTRPRPSAFGASAEARLTTGSLAGARVLLRFADRGAHAPLPHGTSIGAELALAGRLRRPVKDPDATFDFAAHLRRRGIAGELLVDRVRVTGGRRGGIAGALDRLRGRAERAVSAGLPEPDAALALGMVLGEDEQIDSATRDDWRDSGLSHLLAVSGQNVMLLMALAFPLLVAAGLGPRGRGVALLCLVAVYVPLAGAGPSLQRAGVMGAAGIAAMTLSRPSSRWYALLLAAAVTLSLNPRACGDPGWQLSFVAVAGILVAGRPLAASLRRIAEELTGPPSRARRSALARAVVDGLCEGIAITVAATLATAPLLAHHFGSVPLAGLPANLLALPAVAPAMWLGMVKAALGLAAPLLPASGQLAEALGPITRLPIDYLDGLAERCATLPGGRLELPLGSAPAVVAAYAAMTALAYGPRLARQAAATRRARGEAGAGRACGSLPDAWRARFSRVGALQLAAAWRRRPRALRVGTGALAATVLVLGGSAWLATPAPPDTLTVRFLDIGQGDATLIQDGAGAAALFDGGPPEARVYRQLRAAGVHRLDLMVATHQSRDHQGGLHEVIDHIPASLLLENSDGTTDRDFRRLIREAEARGIRHLPAREGQVLRVGGLRIEILSPAPLPPDAPAPEDPNPRGVAAIVSAGDFDLWLSADAESDAILPLALRPVEAMKVSHHGSADPGLPEVLKRLQPQVAAIEVGADNSYGHPTTETLAALHAAVPRVYRTDRDGTVTLTVRDGHMDVTTEH
jgi:competence protein ComEC